MLMVAKGYDGLGDRLKVALDHTGMSMNSVGEKAGLGLGYVSRIISGHRRRVNVNILQSLAEVLGVSFEWLSTGAGEMLPKAERKVSAVPSSGLVAVPMRKDAQESFSPNAAIVAASKAWTAETLAFVRTYCATRPGIDQSVAFWFRFFAKMEALLKDEELIAKLDGSST